MLKTFEECPKKYELKFINNISVPQDATPFEKGKKIHALANYYLKGFDISKLENTLNENEKLVWQNLTKNEYFNKKYLQSEYNLLCKVADYWIGGRIDALVQDDERIYILDYKTGSVPQNPKYDYQTIIYLLCVSKFFKQKNISFVYIDLKNNQNHMINYDEELEKEYTQKITNICERIIKTQTFNNIQKCKFCEYRKIC